MNIKELNFFNEYRTLYGRLTQPKVDGLSQFLSAVEQSPIKDLRQLAYMFATVKHECADQWKPIKEYGQGRGRKYGKSVTVETSEGQKENVYYGRGYVQLTWAENYEKMSQKLFNDNRLYHNPDLALEPAIAFDIMTIGMEEGIFTSKAFHHYLSDTGTDYYNAGKIVNGLDQARKIEQYALQFEQILFRSIRSL